MSRRAWTLTEISGAECNNCEDLDLYGLLYIKLNIQVTRITKHIFMKA